MKKIKKLILYIFLMLMITSLSELVFTIQTNGLNDFILPPWGGGMVHCDPPIIGKY